LRLLSILFSTFFFAATAIGQTSKAKQDVVQFSGVVVSEEEGEILVLPYTAVAVDGTSRGTFTEVDGFFSIVVVKGETIVFSRIGYETTRFVIPDTLTTHHYSFVQSLTKDTVLLPEAVIYPWPNKDNFKEEFLAMDVRDEVQELANKNLDPSTLERLRKNIPYDARDMTSLVLRDNVNKLHTRGQLNVLNILNPQVWKKFINKWRGGGFKKKDKEKNAFDIFTKDKIGN